MRIPAEKFTNDLLISRLPEELNQFLIAEVVNYISIGQIACHELFLIFTKVKKEAGNFNVFSITARSRY
jgi:hypothetical protein